MNSQTKKTETHRERISKVRKYRAVVAIACIGVGLTLVGFLAALKEQRSRIQNDLDRAGQSRAFALRQAIDLHQTILIALASFFDSTREVTRDRFSAFLDGTHVIRRGLCAGEWIPRVPDAQRAAYEAGVREEGFPDFQITEIGSQGKMVRAPRRSEYFPVHFIVPFEGNERTFGFDLSSEPERWEALVRARDTGEMTASAPVTLVLKKGTEIGFPMFLAVYRKGEPADSVEARRESLEGFVVTVERIKDLMDCAFAGFAPSAVDVRVFDAFAPEDSRLLYFHSSRARQTPGEAIGDEAALRAGPHHEATLEVAGRQWIVLSTPTPAFVAARRTWAPWGVLVFGLLFSVLMTNRFARAQRSAVQARRFAAEQVQSRRRVEEALEEQERAREALRKSEERFRNVAESMSDWIWEIDARGVYTYASSKVEPVLGYAPAELLGKTPFDFMPPEEAERARPQFRAISENKKPIRDFENWNLTKDSRRVCLLTNGIPKLNDRGDLLGYLGVDRDITKRKRTEDILRRELKMATVGTLARGMAHEINNPMNGIMNYAQLILDSKDLEEKLREYAREIISETERVTRIVRHLQTIATEGDESYSATRMDDIVNRAVSLARENLRKDGIDLRVDVSTSLPRFRSESRQVQEALASLLANARDALNERYPGRDANKVIVVTGREIEKDGVRRLRVTIEDHGVGIPPKIAVRIFDPFFTTKSRSQHSGLPLAVSQAVIRGCGGDMSFESELGQYTRFHLDLPVDNGPPDTDEPEASASTEKG